MNQNKSNVPVSVAEEPDELSYYRLTLLAFLRESHPDLADDESFVATRSEQAAEAFSAAVRSGLTYDDAAQQANALLFQGLHFSPLDTLVTVLWNEFAAEVPEGVRKNSDRARARQPMRPRFYVSVRCFPSSIKSRHARA